MSVKAGDQSIDMPGIASYVEDDVLEQIAVPVVVERVGIGFDVVAAGTGGHMEHSAALRRGGVVLDGGYQATKLCIAGRKVFQIGQLAQGAGMAIEDGLHLANLIVANEDDFDTTFTQFTKDRYLRCARVTLESRYIWEFYHGEGIEREVQYQINKDRNEADPYECISWLYDGFPFSS